jgi:hypothetical protein
MASPPNIIRILPDGVSTTFGSGKPGNELVLRCDQGTPSAVSEATAVPISEKGRMP